VKKFYLSYVLNKVVLSCYVGAKQNTDKEKHKKEIFSIKESFNSRKAEKFKFELEITLKLSCQNITKLVENKDVQFPFIQII
jgi:hypothetical protein